MRTWELAAALLVASLIGSGVPESAFAVSPARVAAPKGTPPRVTVSLVSDIVTLEPGSTFWVGLRQRIAPGWHTYWINPGDSGEPPNIEWSLPAGFTAGPIVWPAPERVPVTPFMSYGYTHEVVLPIQITAPGHLDVGTPVTLRGHVSWLVCERICIPEEADVALTLPVGEGKAAPAPTALVEQARRTVPALSPWPATLSATPETVTIKVAAPGLAVDRIVEAAFFPMRWGVIDHAAPQTVSIDRRGITLHTARGLLPEATATDVDGVLMIKERLDQGTVSQAFTIRAAVGKPSTAGSASLTLLAALGLALAGGLILNLMPCVLPVLSVKAVALVAHAHTSAAVIRRHGIAYTAGVLVSFAALAAVLIALRAGGAEIGWGFQLQSPLVVTTLAYLLFALALSLSGLLVIGTRLTGIGHGLASRPGYAGSFFTGTLATIAATPCTAPFMGVAIGFALTQPPMEALAVFEALGLGLALPFLALSLVPAWRRLLPKPGRWMERLRQILALPLYASVAWLVWVVSRQAGLEGAALVLAGLVLIGVAAWLHHGTRLASPRWRRAAVAVSLGCVAAAVAIGPLAASSASSATTVAAPSGARWEPFTPERLAELRARGVPVFVNATAAWCITCLVNERVALHSPAVAEAFTKQGVVYLKADWTNKSPQIAAFLESFGRSGVPLYVVYGRNSRQPQLLPQILSERTLIEAVETL
jgi:thiol:disulfide interchange protein